MKELINVNILLCQDYDEKEVSMHKIFDSIVIEGDKASFSIAIIINTVEYTKKKFSLHFFLVNLEKNKQVYIGEDAFEHWEGTGDSEDNKVEPVQSSIEACSQKISVFRLDDVQFISEGAHEILVYLYEDDGVEEAKNAVKEKILVDVQKNENLVATYGFKVKYKE